MPEQAKSNTQNSPRCFTDLLDQIIRKQGFSVREAKKIRQAIFHFWARAICRGAVVDTPLGQIKAVRSPKKRARINRMYKAIEYVYTYERRISFKPWPWRQLLGAQTS